MPFKTRTESNELKMLRILNTRFDLSAEEKKHYLNLEKGYEGEVKFDLLTEQLQCECYILNELLLKVNNRSFQIDTTIIFQETINFSEVKNYNGDFTYEKDIFKTVRGKEYQNPLEQVNRNKSLLRPFLHDLGCNLPIVGNAVFINPEFTLYHASPNLPFIFPSQLNQFMKKLNTTQSHLNHHHKLLAEKIVALHQTKSPYSIQPEYQYKKIQKGFTCGICRTFNISISSDKRILICGECGYEEMIETAILRCVEEIKLLFPDLKITTNIVYDWCGQIGSKKRIHRILIRNYNLKGFGQWSYYE